jgi:hypothetical protein
VKNDAMNSLLECAKTTMENRWLDALVRVVQTDHFGDFKVVATVHDGVYVTPFRTAEDELEQRVEDEAERVRSLERRVRKETSSEYVSFALKGKYTATNQLEAQRIAEALRKGETLDSTGAVEEEDDEDEQIGKRNGNGNGKGKHKAIETDEDDEDNSSALAPASALATVAVKTERGHNKFDLANYGDGRHMIFDHAFWTEHIDEIVALSEQAAERAQKRHKGPLRMYQLDEDFLRKHVPTAANKFKGAVYVENHQIVLYYWWKNGFELYGGASFKDPGAEGVRLNDGQKSLLRQLRKKVAEGTLEDTTVEVVALASIAEPGRMAREFEFLCTNNGIKTLLLLDSIPKAKKFYGNQGMFQMPIVKGVGCTYAYRHDKDDYDDNEAPAAIIMCCEMLPGDAQQATSSSATPTTTRSWRTPTITMAAADRARARAPEPAAPAPSRR